jgi:hypothetical protein
MAENNFAGLTDLTTVASTDAENEKQKAAAEAKKAAAAATKAAYNKRIAEDPTFKENCGSEKNNLEVTKCLGYGTKGLIEAKKGNKETGEQRVLQGGLPEIVGYRVKNVGNKPYRYTTEKWEKNAEGEWVATSVEKELLPGTEADMCKVTFFTMLLRTEFGLQTGNGTSVIKGTNTNKSAKEIFKRAYFKFNADTGINVHDDKVTQLIGPKDDTSVIDAPYLEEFGFLLNKPAKGKKAGTKKADKASALIMLTAFMQQMDGESQTL